MKKYILFIVSTIVLAFVSCTSSEDIEINDIQSKYQAVFKVNPSTVVEPFTWQHKPGELSTIPSNSKLRIRALIYDNTGKLVYEKVEQFTNYEVLMSFKTELEKGIYTVIAISDVINLENEKVPEYWILSKNYSQLNETELTSAGYIGYQRNILGIASQSISVSSTNNEYKIDIKPAGAVVYTYFFGIHEYSDIKSYQLDKTQGVKKGVFDLNGNFKGILENNDNKYNWRMNVIYPQRETSDWGYVINYELPQNNLRLRFAGYTSEKDDDPNRKGYWFGEEMHIPTIKAGEQYLVMIDITDSGNGYGVGYDNVTGLKNNNTSSIAASVQPQIARTNNVSYFKNVK